MNNLKTIMLMTCCSMMIGLNLSPVVAKASTVTNESKTIMETTPLEDLNEDESFVQRNASGAFPSLANGDIQLVKFIEYKYDIQYYDQFNLFVYLYNPVLSRNIEKISSRNMIQMRVGDAGNYYKYDLNFVSSEKDSKFLKFKIGFDKAFYDSLTKSKRIYTLSSVEILNVGDNNATSYDVSSRYTYTGFVAGANNNQSDYTLNCEVDGLETLHLDVNCDYYRMGSTADGSNYVKDLFYCYFNVPAYYSKNYGNVKKIHANYTKAYLDNIYVIDESFKESNKVYDYGIYANGYGFVKGLNGNTYYSYSQLSEQIFSYYVSDYKTAIIDGNEIEERLYKYGDPFEKKLLEYGTDELKNKCAVKRDRIYSETDPNINILSYKDTHNDWEKFWAKWLGTDIDAPSINCPVIQIATSLSNSDGTNYYLNPNDVNRFNDNYAKANLAQAKTYLFRYDVGNYSVYEMHGVNRNPLSPLDTINTDYHGYMSSMHAILDFDIIDITFAKNGNETIMPIAMSPKNIIPGTTPPASMDFSWWDKLLELIKLVVIAVLVIVAIALINKVLPFAKILLWPIATFIKWLKQSPKKNKKKKN